MPLEIAIGLGVAVLFIGLMLWMPGHLRRHPDQRSASNSSSSGLVGSVDEVFHPEAAAARLEFDEQQRLVVPAPATDDDHGISDGRIRIVLDEGDPRRG